MPRRLSIARALADHDQRPAATLVNLHTESVSASGDYPDPNLVDRVLVTADGGDVTTTLPEGSEAIDGRIFGIQKVAGAYSAILAGDAIEGGTELAASELWEIVEVYWSQTLGKYIRVSNSVAGAPPAASTIGDGSGSPTLTLNKSAGGVAHVIMEAAGVVRGSLSMDANEHLRLVRYDNTGAELDAITYNNSTGMVTLPAGLTVTTGGATIAAGGLTITAGGVSVVAGNVVLTAGVRAVINAPSAADDAAAAALSPAVPIGGFYHTAGAVKQRLA